MVVCSIALGPKVRQHIMVEWHIKQSCLTHGEQEGKRQRKRERIGLGTRSTLQIQAPQ
jgi:hypothetical protein